jgi:hypothetical protein
LISASVYLSKRTFFSAGAILKVFDMLSRKKNKQAQGPKKGLIILDLMYLVFPYISKSGYFYDLIVTRQQVYRCAKARLQTRARLMPQNKQAG